MTVPDTIEHARRQLALGQFAAAERLCREVLVQQPRHAVALHLLGIVVYSAGNAPGAEAFLRQAVEAEPGNARHHNDLGLLLSILGRPGEALAAHLEAVRLQPGFAEAHGNAGNVLKELGRLQEACQAYRASLRAQPAQAQVYNNLGVALAALGDRSAAIECYRAALGIQPSADILFNCANAQREAGQLREAVESYRAAIRLRPADYEAYNSLCSTLSRLGRHAEALLAIQEALRIKPDYAEGFCTLALAHRAQGNFEAAADALAAAIALQPGLMAAHHNLGLVLAFQCRLDEALREFRTAMELAPAEPKCGSNLIYHLQFHPEVAPRAIRAEAERWNTRHAEPLRRFISAHQNARVFPRRLRLGYVSPDFRDHVVGRNILPLLRNHDHGDFEITCYSGVLVPDHLTREFESNSDRWRVTIGLSDEAMAAQIRADQIDILMDLALHMEGNRLLVFARKPAPVQVTFAGYPGTTGLAAMDYRLTDPHLDPPGSQDDLYVERSFRLAASFWCFDALSVDVPVTALPAAENGGITFGCACTFQKVNERTLRLWGRILAEVMGSRLLLLVEPGRGRAVVLEILAQGGIGPERVEFMQSCSRVEHLRRHRLMDIALDPFPYNGHTSTLEALWLGIPVITLTGASAIARGGFSILSNLGLTELAAGSEEEYVETAVKLAHDLPRLTALRANLRGRLEASPLMDTRRFTRDIEAAYRAMWQRWCEETA
jgi:protein O-GlcNAc transferase